MCQRYYEKSYDVGTVPGTATRLGSIYITAYSNIVTIPVQWKVTKRGTPVVQTYSTETGASGQIRGTTSDLAATISTQSQSASWAYASIAAGYVDMYCQWTADAEL